MHGNPDKKPLTLDKSPFLVFIEHGENREGYWAYNNMVVLQFEDAVDVLKVMYPEFDAGDVLKVIYPEFDAGDVLKVIHPEFDFVFLFDHSAGLARQRPDGLNQHQMNKAFGAKLF